MAARARATARLARARRWAVVGALLALAERPGLAPVAAVALAAEPGAAVALAERPGPTPPARHATPAAPTRPAGSTRARPRFDTRPPPSVDGAPDRAPPANPGAGCTPGGTGLDTSTAGVVLDRRTCLAWQQQDPTRDVSACPLMIRDHPSKLCYDEAVEDCQALRLDGKSDWRLPTVAELQGLVVAGNSPTIDRAAFPEAVLSLYWSSQTSAGKVTCVDFSNRGNVNPNIGPDGPQAFRCVRGPVAAP